MPGGLRLADALRVQVKLVGSHERGKKVLFDGDIVSNTQSPDNTANERYEPTEAGKRPTFWESLDLLGSMVGTLDFYPLCNSAKPAIEISQQLKEDSNEQSCTFVSYSYALRYSSWMPK
ncbi:uncharacterized protein PGTG_04569 [Puccinia graminis f. sp. tritici CRL 75-36-700-3]|uniref:Uncharacterized protein n=1 Tax=Puccinia graminis f. sp. tritici (strain CRL 75-36-700-3 / race SCCL) TaxID=418459 RepID=E3K2P4_PUCGT|nr:uncharacterized protein PGTG_04569 [Puccinia graminis f. sp. tritici CRL 75-36-700-3]EFP78613.1 hypothetical protein PGTG_04569 [Puccinia graminis f. sp. tritici CRL 75-36-700-3]